MTAAGAHFLGLLPGEPDERPSLPIVIGPDFQIKVPAPASLYTRFQLERFTDPSSSGTLRQKAASQEPWLYRLTAGSLGRALAQGIRVEQVLAFLRQASEGPVPANVAGQLRLWAGRFGQVQLEEAAILRVKNERVLKELSVLPETRSLLGEILSHTSVLVRKQNLAQLRKALRALGYLPAKATDDLAERG